MIFRAGMPVTVGNLQSWFNTNQIRHIIYKISAWCHTTAIVKMLVCTLTVWCWSLTNDTLESGEIVVIYCSDRDERQRWHQEHICYCSINRDVEYADCCGFSWDGGFIFPVLVLWWLVLCLDNIVPTDSKKASLWFLKQSKLWASIWVLSWAHHSKSLGSGWQTRRRGCHLKAWKL